MSDGPSAGRGDEKPPTVMAKCPWCRKPQNSDDHEVDWYFACCGTTRLVWRRIKRYPGLELEPVEEDMKDGPD